MRGSARRCRAVDKPSHTTDRIDPGSRQRAVARLNSRQNLSLARAGHVEREIAAAIERRISERDAGRLLRAGHGNNPAPFLLQRRIAGEQRGGMAVLADAQQCHIEQRPAGIKLCRAVEALQGRLVIGGHLSRRQALRGNSMDALAGDLDARQQCVLSHVVIAGGVVVRDET